MADSEIVSRIQDFFERQIVWLENVKTRFPNPEEPWPEDLEELVGAASLQSKEVKAFEEEFAALKREWDATAGVQAQDRAALSELARRAEALTQEVRTLTEGAEQTSREQARLIQDELGTLGKGRTDLMRYKVDTQEPGFMDRKA